MIEWVGNFYLIVIFVERFVSVRFLYSIRHNKSFTLINFAIRFS